MILKVLICFFIYIYFGTTLEIFTQDLDNMYNRDGMLYSGPSTVQSIKAHLYEENQKVNKVKPRSRTQENFDGRKQIKSHNENNHQNFKSYISDKVKPVDGSESDEKNDTIELHKKEIEFESLIIKNNQHHNEHIPKLNKKEYNTDNIDNQDFLFDSNDNNNSDDPTRRFFPNTMYQSLLPNLIEEPIIDNNTVANNDNPSDANVMDILQSIVSNESKPVPPNNTINEINCSPCDKIVDESDKSSVADDDIESRNSMNYTEQELKEPTTGLGITAMRKSRLMLMNHPRVCYACSSTNDPSCWKPNRRTSVKYCREDHDACLAKLFIFKGSSYIIRDCGNSCVKRNLLDLTLPLYKTCTICHSDMCNSANAFRNSNIIIVFFIMCTFKMFC